jgi:phenylacetate-coenzyme A ligase PaaK-like adenylate-forming protein
MEFFLPHAGDAALRLSPEELIARTDNDLQERDLFRQAARSALYGPRWRAAGVKPDRLHGRAALRELPFIDGSDLLTMAATGAGIRKALFTLPRIWVTSRGAPPVPRKWLPLTLDDVAHWFRRAQRVLELVAEHDGAQKSTLFLAMNEAMPRVANAVPYLWERADYLSGARRFEFLIAATSMLWRNHWDRFALQKQPRWLAGSVSDARILARELGEDAPRLMARPALGLFWGEPLDAVEGADKPGARADLEALYGLGGSFSLYFSAECREMYAECPAHAGLHLWLDGTIHEILTTGSDAETRFVDEAAPGTEGEYVVTTLGEALPLVRYRTGDRIRIVGTEPCACGITHPRVRFLGRIRTPASASGSPER